MKIVLFSNYYVDNNVKRQEEIDSCLIQNLWCKNLNTVIIIVSQRDKNQLIDLLSKYNIERFLLKVLIKVCSKRPTYNDWFKFTREFSNEKNINCIANSDICFNDDSLNKLAEYYFLSNDCLALTRWDIDSINSFNNATFFNRIDSQDIWIRKGTFSNILGADFTLGIAGCDNKIGHLLNQVYTLKNPSLTIKTYHLHNTNIRNYIVHSHVERLPPPYLKLPPSI
tara:strand:+ start:316 stop:990 length:675 start_codon:yes stop_codon:yes gene_type:complete